MPGAKSQPAAASATANRLYIGTSGWAYSSWKPAFYPEGTPARRFLEVYASQLTSVEVNYTFRKLPAAAQLQAWLDATPPGFRFSFKAPQRITHFQRLVGSDQTLAEFVIALTPAHTAGKLGPLLFQLPPNFKADTTKLAAFLDSPALQGNKYLQLAFEFRHTSWFTEEIYTVLRRCNAALCVADSEALITPDVATADFRCYRLRMPGGYSTPKLKALAKRFAALAESQDVFIYLKHEDEPTGALNAAALLKLAAGTKPERTAA